MHPSLTFTIRSSSTKASTSAGTDSGVRLNDLHVTDISVFRLLSCDPLKVRSKATDEAGAQGPKLDIPTGIEQYG